MSNFIHQARPRRLHMKEELQDQNTAKRLFKAVDQGDISSLKPLLRNFSFTPKELNQALIINAARNNRVEACKILITAGADPIGKQCRALVNAALHGSIDVVKFLIPFCKNEPSLHPDIYLLPGKPHAMEVLKLLSDAQIICPVACCIRPFLPKIVATDSHEWLDFFTPHRDQMMLVAHYLLEDAIKAYKLDFCWRAVNFGAFLRNGEKFDLALVKDILCKNGFDLALAEKAMIAWNNGNEASAYRILVGWWGNVEALPQNKMNILKFLLSNNIFPTSQEAERIRLIADMNYDEELGRLLTAVMVYKEIMLS